MDEKYVDATNDIFAENAWYFRNSLVRANYNDLKNGIHEGFSRLNNRKEAT